MATAAALIPAPLPRDFRDTQLPPELLARRELVRLWTDERRIIQRGRILAMKQPTDAEALRDEAEAVWREACARRDRLPKGYRIVVPSRHVFARLLGLLHRLRTLPGNPLDEIELSVEEVAEAVGYSRSTTHAALRWLRGGPITIYGQVLSGGLGLVYRARRTGWAYAFGKLSKRYRTCRLGLTTAGQVAVGLLEPPPGADEDEPEAMAFARELQQQQLSEEKLRRQRQKRRRLAAERDAARAAERASRQRAARNDDTPRSTPHRSPPPTSESSDDPPDESVAAYWRAEIRRLLS